MTHNKEAVDRIEKLIQTNIDRVAGYEKAIEATDDPHLKSVFEQNRDQSSGYLNELRPIAVQLGGDVENDTSTASDVFRGWMDIKDAFSPNNNQSVLNWCEKGEDIAKNAYYKVVTDDVAIEPTVREVITKQQSGILSMHDLVKSLRDANKEG